VSEKIFPSLATGFSDSEPVIRENSLKSILNIINKLNDSIVNGELLRILAKTQNDAIPEIRANTTILLGRIATSFSKSTKSTVLIAAFSRALKDSFVQSRIAALLALSATAEQFTPPEICSKLVGALAPSLIDSDKSVRQQAQITMDMFMTKVRVHAKTLDDKTGNESSQSKGMSSLFDNDVSLFDSPNSSAKSATERVKSAPPEKKHTTTLLPTTTVPLPTFTDKAFDVDLDDTNEWDEGWDDKINNNIDEVNDAWGFDDEKNDKLPKKTKSLSLEPKEDGEDDAWSNWD
jgi:SCY1-like protein 1